MWTGTDSWDTQCVCVCMGTDSLGHRVCVCGGVGWHVVRTHAMVCDRNTPKEKK